MASEIFRKPFDLVQGPLYRVVDLRRTTNDHLLVFAIHHAVADGWSLGLFVEELFAAYLQGLTGSSGALPPVPQTYAAWGAAERAFWTTGNAGTAHRVLENQTHRFTPDVEFPDYTGAAASDGFPQFLRL